MILFQCNTFPRFTALDIYPFILLIRFCGWKSLKAPTPRDRSGSGHHEGGAQAPSLPTKDEEVRCAWRLPFFLRLNSLGDWSHSLILVSRLGFGLWSDFSSILRSSAPSAPAISWVCGTKSTCIQRSIITVWPLHISELVVKRLLKMALVGLSTFNHIFL